MFLACLCLSGSCLKQALRTGGYYLAKTYVNILENVLDFIARLEIVLSNIYLTYLEGCKILRMFVLATLPLRLFPLFLICLFLFNCLFIMREVIPTANLFHIITFFNYQNSFGNRNILTNLKIYIKFCGKRQKDSSIVGLL